jgi:hypothetical protein
MKKGRILIALVLGIAVLAAFTIAYAQTKAPDKDITIESKDVFKERKKAPVVFNHEKHKALQCTVCHHEVQDGKKVEWKEGQPIKKCGACHKLEDQGPIVKLEKAMHNQCVECHKKVKKEKKPTGPTACTKCHPGGKDEPEK